VSVWAADSADALALLARCLPRGLLALLWQSNPLAPELVLASNLRAVRRLSRGY
jgi:hypothetical protein